MNLFKTLAGLTRSQRNAIIASFLGWMLDAFDFFILVMVVSDIAADFHTGVKDVAYGIFLTLFARPFGAFIFGYLADRFGRRPILMIDVLLFALFEFGSAFAPDLATLLVMRFLFGIAMGGEWGIGSSLVMETIPVKTRGIVSGLLQEGYALGYLLAAVSYWVVFPYIGWRGMFVVGAVPRAVQCLTCSAQCGFRLLKKTIPKARFV